ncbi:MAG: hypothetical protein AAGA50_21040 [Pseudomonadota bacterium]
MMHTGDIFEQRARAARHRELRALVRALSGFLFRPIANRNSGQVRTSRAFHPMNDHRAHDRDHAA